ncbi:ATP-binding protein [Streptomyces sp. 8N114]|uniref:ATP-binding protein n=1 Tax=Streptomyces sp. 8N114 TaxID=3457419 RepID=UPI003FD66B84
MGNPQAASGFQSGSPVHEFSMHFPSSPQGARLARRLATSRLYQWGYNTDVPALLVGELVANAVEHCHTERGEFRLRVTVDATGSRGGGAASTLIAPEASATSAAPSATAPVAALLVEVADACGEHRPRLQQPMEDAESGRGMLLVDVLATAWDSYENKAPDRGKTVWCTCPLTRQWPGGSARPTVPGRT